MYIVGLGSAFPEHRYTKTDCWDAFKKSPWFERLDRRARWIAEKVLQRDNGIQARWLCIESLDEVFAIDPATLHARFLANAPVLAAQAARRAMADANIVAADVDAVIVSTCTGYVCPGLSSYVSELLGLPSTAHALDLVGQGCGAALPNMRTGAALLAAETSQCVLSICVEVCSAAMYLDNDPGVLISACLFGDGAGAAILSRRPFPEKRSVQWKAASSLVIPAERDALRFEQRDGLLRNILTLAVPKLAATYAERVFSTVLDAEDFRKDDITGWIWHAGGRDVMDALRDRFGLTADDLKYSAAVLHESGNLSSAFVYVVLQKALEENAPGGHWWMGSFGAGFSSHGALLEVA